jgi:hypothetical protein
MFFTHQTPEAIIEAIHIFERDSQRFDPGACRRNACRFSIKRFRKEFTGLCEEKVAIQKAEAEGHRDRTAMPGAIEGVLR